MAENTINFTIEVFQEFLKARNAAVLQEKDTFMFQNNEISVDYANYVIQYIAIQMDLDVRTSYISKN